MNRLYLIVIFIPFIFSCKKDKPQIIQHKYIDTTNKDSVTLDPNLLHYINPVLNTDFPDPAILLAQDGYYYSYATNGKYDGVFCTIQVARSADMVNWEHLGDAMPVQPDWASGDFWAPHVIYDDSLKKYFMYFSGENNGKCLGVATSNSPEGPFVDKGTPLLCGDGFVNIDPMAFDDPQTGKHYLFWGSGFQAIKVQELTRDRMHFVSGSQPKGLIYPNGGEPYKILVEGNWVIYRNGKYYMFYSGDNCCGTKAHYAVMVARADSPTGPFTEFKSPTENSSVILRDSYNWRGPGHNSIITDKAGNDWIVYHAMRPEDMARTFRVMLIDRILWVEGWPRVYNDQPSNVLCNAPVVN